MADSLLGHLITRFTNSPENLATEGLNFILNRSRVARESFVNLLGHLNILIPPDLKFETQDSSTDDTSIPDLVGRDGSGNALLLGESKFWAGLTDHQPVTYMSRLKQSNGTALIFFAPSKRLPMLWPELLRRCNYASIPLLSLQTEISDIRRAKFYGEQFLVLISWRALLLTIQQSLEMEGESEMLGNLVQLQGLCDRMDDTAFLPLRPEELTSMISTRILQYCDLVDEIVQHLVSNSHVALKGLRATPFRTGYRRYFSLNQRGYSFDYDPILWSKYRSTPLWLGIQSTSWGYDPEAKNKLISFELEEPSRLFREGDILYVPIFLETGVEKDEVVKLIIQQIQAVFELLA